MNVPPNRIVRRAALAHLLAVLVALVVPGVAGDTAAVSRRADLPPLLEMVDGTRVRTVEQLEARRQEIARLLGEHLVGFPPEETPRILAAATLEESRDEDGARRRRVQITLDTPRRTSVEVVVWIPPGEGPWPLLLTQPRYYQLPWAELALARGYMVCLYPGVDSFHREEAYPGWDSLWRELRAQYPEATWSEIRTKAWLASRALDHLLDPASGYRVARGQVAIIGFSRYGKQSLVAAAFDPRITCVVARSPGSPGSCPYRFTSRNTFAEAPADFPGEWFLPSLRGYTGREDELPIDAHGWYALLAPRRVLIDTAHNDGSEPTFAVERAFRQGLEVYGLLGAPSHLRVSYRAGQHGPITDEQRRRNLDWIDLAFGRGGHSDDEFPLELLHAFDWEAWRRAQPSSVLVPPEGAGVKEAISWLLGEASKIEGPRRAAELLTPAESAMMTHDRWAVAGVRRTPIAFGEGVRGNLYWPETAREPLPVVVWLHPFSYHSGYNEGYGVEGTTIYHRLAAAGYAVLAYDQCGFGLRLLEGPGFYDRHPRWSRFGRLVDDARGAVDFVVDGEGAADGRVPALDGDRIILLGYSLGGLVALHTGALDSRVAAVASFCGFEPFRTDDDVRTDGGLARYSKWHALLPKLGLFIGRESRVPYDVDDLLRSIAPRPCLVVSPRGDRMHDVAKVRAAVSSAASAWPDGEGARGLDHRMPEGSNRFQREQQELFLEWAGRALAD